MNILEIIGLLMNFVGTFILTLPSLIRTREFDEEKDKIVDREINGKHIYTTNRIERDTKFNRIAMVFVIMGFVITLLGLFNLKLYEQDYHNNNRVNSKGCHHGFN